jgi:hypothetical protein
MQPTHENIDRWLFDYTEGNLSAQQEQQLDSFIMNHPDLELDLDAWELAKVDVTPMVFENKTYLYKKRSYKKTFVFASLLILLISALVFFQPGTKKVIQTNNTNQKSMKNSAVNTQRTNTNTTTSRVNSDQLASLTGKSNAIPVSTPYGTTRMLAGQNSPITDELEQFSMSNASKDLTKIALVNFESTNSQNNLTGNFNDETPLLNLYPLKNMLIGGYRTDFKNEKLSFGKDHVAADVSLGNIDLFRKIDQLLSKDIGLSNNQSYDYAITGQSNLDLNFSSVGTTSQTRFQAVSSMRSFDNPSQLKLVNQLSLDGYSRAMRAGFGIQANYDIFSEGLIKNSQVAFIISPKIALSRKISIEPALRFKMGTQTLNQNKLKNFSTVEMNNGQVNQFQFDSTLAIGQTLWSRDLDAGLTLHTPFFFLSAQINNLFQHNENIFTNDGSTLRASNVWNVIAGTQYTSRNEKMIFATYALYQETNYQQQLFGGFTFKAGKAQFGMSYGNLTTGNLSLGYVGENFALIGQSGFGTLISTQQRTYTHQLTLRIHSSVSKKARRYISL